MSIRKQIRTTLASVDRRLGVREWLRENGGPEAVAQSAQFDPFTSAPELQHPRALTVLDIGGNYGQFATEAFRAFPGATVYSFEPIPECLEKLSALRTEHPTLHTFPLALSDRDGETEFHLSRFRDSSSIQEMLPTHLEAWPFTETESKITVQVARLDTVAAQLDLRPPVFAKLDVQGHELAVIRGGRATLSLCQRVMTECNFAPLYKGQPTFVELYEEMRSLGFLFEGFISLLRHPRTLELLSADAIFYRPAVADMAGQDTQVAS
ncbi:MAG TPA: FkbM family methyltransferase [Pyrinomonadaceae bacterium]|jgi:FkbM family methyltransferase|nr:FkbM family methyltransferase [Pyrinomonadaceae bacterium]